MAGNEQAVQDFEAKADKVLTRLEKVAKGAGCPLKAGNPPPPGQKPDKDVEKLPEALQDKAYAMKRKDKKGKKDEKAPPCPGSKLRSGGMGRGLGRGKGKGPVGVPVGAKFASLNAPLADAALMLLDKRAKKLTPGSLKGGKSEPASKAPAGEGGRFKAMKKKLGGKVRDPGAVAAAIGRAKFGKKKFQSMAAKGRKSSSIWDNLQKQSGVMDWLMPGYSAIRQKQLRGGGGSRLMAFFLPRIERARAERKLTEQAAAKKQPQAPATSAASAARKSLAALDASGGKNVASPEEVSRKPIGPAVAQRRAGKRPESLGKKSMDKSALVPGAGWLWGGVKGLSRRMSGGTAPSAPAAAAPQTPAQAMPQRTPKTIAPQPAVPQPAAAQRMPARPAAMPQQQMLPPPMPPGAGMKVATILKKFAETVRSDFPKAAEGGETLTRKPRGALRRLFSGGGKGLLGGAIAGGLTVPALMAIAEQTMSDPNVRSSMGETGKSIPTNITPKHYLYGAGLGSLLGGLTGITPAAIGELLAGPKTRYATASTPKEQTFKLANVAQKAAALSPPKPTGTGWHQYQMAQNKALQEHMSPEFMKGFMEWNKGQPMMLGGNPMFSYLRETNPEAAEAITTSLAPLKEQIRSEGKKQQAERDKYRASIGKPQRYGSLADVLRMSRQMRQPETGVPAMPVGGGKFVSQSDVMDMLSKLNPAQKAAAEMAVATPAGEKPGADPEFPEEESGLRRFLRTGMLWKPPADESRFSRFLRTGNIRHKPSVAQKAAAEMTAARNTKKEKQQPPKPGVETLESASDTPPKKAPEKKPEPKESENEVEMKTAGLGALAGGGLLGLLAPNVSGGGAPAATAPGAAPGAAAPGGDLLSRIQQARTAAQTAHDEAPWYSRWFRTVGSFQTPEQEALMEQGRARAKELYGQAGKGTSGLIFKKQTPEAQQAATRADALRRAMGMKTQSEQQQEDAMMMAIPFMM